MNPHAVNLQAAELRAGFPRAMGTAVVATAEEVGLDPTYALHFRRNPETVSVGAEQLRLLHRMGFDPAATANDRTLLAAFRASHYDGRVRILAVRPLLASREAWTLPFVLELASDYVVEILEALAKEFDVIDRANLRAYLAENPKHLELTVARINSYWDAYYRTYARPPGSSTRSKHAGPDAYPGFRILAEISRSR